MITLTLPSTPEQVAAIPSKDLRKVARAMGVSPTITNAAGTRIYKPSALLRIELEKFLDTPPVEVPQMDAEVIIEPPAVVVEETKIEKAHVKVKPAKEPHAVMVEPGEAQSPLKMGTKVCMVAETMLLGATLPQLQELTGQPPSGTKVYFYWNLKNKGLGTRQVGDRYFLVLPQGQTELIYK